ncbi:MAG: hypothetical protein JO187_10235, partial [Acidobacteria bacterium]|nr:hypothetical protein [Acidobacteriota bacterium]
MSSTATPPVKSVFKSAAKSVDPAHDLLRADRHPLTPLFAPRSVALIGASE